MSRIGRRPVKLGDSVDAKYGERCLIVKGPKGELSFQIPESVEIKIEDKQLSVEADYQNDSFARMMMGTTQAVIHNMVTGVSQGFQKQLNLVGVGYRAKTSGDTLELSLGYSHPVQFDIPTGVTAKVQGNTTVLLESCDKQLLGQVAANIRSLRPPEPYKGKGILIEGEKLIRKAGKAGKK